MRDLYHICRSRHKIFVKTALEKKSVFCDNTDSFPREILRLTDRYIPMILDSHIHIYPGYDRKVLIDSFFANTASIEPSAQARGIVLTERFGTSVFGEWAEGKGLPEGYTATAADANALRLSNGERELLVFAGRQIACRERIEILSIGRAVPVPDGTGVSEATKAVLAAGGLPVLAWGVGKWLFSREQIVKKLLREFPASDLLLCDSSLRPSFWKEPSLMRVPGRRVVSGSDPLEPADEARMAGRYVSVIGYEPPREGELTDALIAVLRDPAVWLSRTGTRSSVTEFLHRR